MTETETASATSTRRIRPWIAGLLTIFGWGLGLFYAKRTRAAINMAVAQVAINAIIGIGLIAFLFTNGPIRSSVPDSDIQSVFDMFGFGLAIIAAIAVGVFVSRQGREVAKSGPVRLWGYLAIWLLPILGAAFITLLLRSFIAQPFSIPAGSMKPTLQVGDYFGAEKWRYGYSRASLIYPLTRMPMDGRIFASAPERGDVVIFKNKKDGNRDYVKRVIGLPGDKVQMISGRLHINGEPVQKELVTANAPDSCGPGVGGAEYRETLDNGVSYIVQECSGNEGLLDNTGVYQVPAGHYFMMGDNRDQSQDSRVVSMVGYIEFDALVGKAHLSEANPQTQN